MKSATFTLLFLVPIFLGCNREEKHLIATAETVLPGNWHIEAVELRGNYGIKYEGSPIRSDTIINDLGTIEIDKFSVAALDYDYEVPGVSCRVEILNEEFPFMIKQIIITGSEIFGYFRWNLPEGVHEFDSTTEEFVWSSRIFNNNYYVVIKNNNSIQLEKANNRKGHVIYLERM